jgi:hypothetical protein
VTLEAGGQADFLFGAQVVLPVLVGA